jgi:hypothetical protein
MWYSMAELNNVKGTRAYIASLVVAFVVLSALADRGGAKQQIITGTVAEFQAGEWIVVASETTDRPPRSGDTLSLAPATRIIEAPLGSTPGSSARCR